MWDKGFADAILWIAIREIIEEEDTIAPREKPDMAFLTSEGATENAANNTNINSDNYADRGGTTRGSAKDCVA